MVRNFFTRPVNRPRHCALKGVYKAIYSTIDEGITMKKTMMTLLVAGAALLGNGLANAGDRHSEYLDRKGDRIERHLDRKGDRIDRRLDRASDRAAANGRPGLARRLDRKGDRIDRRLDRRGDRINHRLDRAARRHESH